jgi:DNA-binding NarL/FixJ family response regulator
MSLTKLHSISKKRIVIVEDNEMVREGFVVVFGSINKYFVANAYSNCEDMIRNLEKDDPDIIIMDIELPGMSGIEGIERVKAKRPEVDIIVNSIYENSGLVFKALMAGATGYITKNTTHLELLAAIEEVINGGAPMSMKIAKMVVSSFKRNTNSILTHRETEILHLLAEGKSYSMIAEELFISKETAKAHLRNIYQKLQVNSKSGAIERARKDKLI